MFSLLNRTDGQVSLFGNLWSTTDIDCEHSLSVPQNQSRKNKNRAARQQASRRETPIGLMPPMHIHKALSTLSGSSFRCHLHGETDIREKHSLILQTAQNFEVIFWRT